MKSETLIKDILKSSKRALAESSVFEPSLSAEALVLFALGLSKEELFANLNQKISQSEQKKIQRLIKQRKKHKPVSQIIGHVNFRGLTFFVNKNVLTPRQETEFLVEETLGVIQKNLVQRPAFNVLDLGTGSGVIACTLAHETRELKPRVEIFASDISFRALKTARKNAEINGLKELILFKRGNLFGPWQNKRFDIVVANLPYIPIGDASNIEKDVLDFEPKEALFSGKDGLDLYRVFLNKLPEYLSENGQAILEISQGQGLKIKKIVHRVMPEYKCIIIKDLAKIDRIAIIYNS